MTWTEADHRSYPMYVEMYKLFLKKSRPLIPFVRLMECMGGLSTEKGLALEAVYVGAEDKARWLLWDITNFSKSASAFLARASVS